MSAGTQSELAPTFVFKERAVQRYFWACDRRSMHREWCWRANKVITTTVEHCDLLHGLVSRVPCKSVGSTPTWFCTHVVPHVQGSPSRSLVCRPKRRPAGAYRSDERLGRCRSVRLTAHRSPPLRQYCDSPPVTPPQVTMTASSPAAIIQVIKREAAAAQPLRIDTAPQQGQSRAHGVHVISRKQQEWGV